jgi:hypothetical protein
MAQSLVVLKFDAPEGAEQGLAIAVKLQKEHLLEIQDAAIVTWPKGKKKPKTRHGADACAGAWYGAFCGMLLGWIFFLPFLGAAFGAAAGAPRRPLRRLWDRQRFPTAGAQQGNRRNLCALPARRPGDNGPGYPSVQGRAEV